METTYITILILKNQNKKQKIALQYKCITFVRKIYHDKIIKYI